MDISSVLYKIYSNESALDFKKKYLGNNEFIFYTLISIVVIYILLYAISFIFRLPIIILISIFIGVTLQRYFEKKKFNP